MTHVHTNAGDTIGMLCDMDRRTLSFYRSDCLASTQLYPESKLFRCHFHRVAYAGMEK